MLYMRVKKLSEAALAQADNCKFSGFGGCGKHNAYVRLLRNTPFSVDYDFPREIQQARSRL
ncbi:hypothetical protein DPMN_097292 [Dreissena polymorpha]|uniref:Uncharacterized protein n=1 Tax=Dreissena polymorpha TaxID=45954 RepID=A0A9D4R5A7_DREPO|nr:hypothetical protein DPMN_097292 [Dreissena polymorpha]